MAGQCRDGGSRELKMAQTRGRTGSSITCILSTFAFLRCRCGKKLGLWQWFYQSEHVVNDKLPPGFSLVSL
jgi:hypothetical protein